MNNAQVAVAFMLGVLAIGVVFTALWRTIWVAAPAKRKYQQATVGSRYIDYTSDHYKKTFPEIQAKLAELTVGETYPVGDLQIQKIDEQVFVLVWNGHLRTTGLGDATHRATLAYWGSDPL